MAADASASVESTWKCQTDLQERRVGDVGQGDEAQLAVHIVEAEAREGDGAEKAEQDAFAREGWQDGLQH